MSQDQPEVVVHLVHHLDYFGMSRIDVTAYALKDEAEAIAKLHGETVETVPVVGAVAFTANELTEIAEILWAKRRELGLEPHEVQAWHDLEVKARSMALLEVVNSNGVEL